MRCSIARLSRAQSLVGWLGRLLSLVVLGVLSAAARAPDADELLARRWHKVELPGLVVVSDASAAKLADWAERIALFQRALQLTCIIPNPREPAPATLFLLNSDSALQDLLPLVDGKRGRGAGYFSSLLGHDCGMVSIGGSRLDARERVQHEITHWHLRRSPVPVPLWLQEGLAQIYETFVVSGGKMRLGQDHPGKREYVRISSNPSLSALVTTTELDMSKAGFSHQRTDLFYAQSWALTHLLFFAAPNNNLMSVSRYIRAVKSGVPAEQSFRDAFLMTSAQAHALLETHIRTPRWRIVEEPIDRASIKTPVVVELVGREREMRLGLLLASGRHAEAAEQLADRLARRDSSDPFPWELRAMLQTSRDGPSPAGISALVKALHAGTRNPSVPLMLGYVAIERSLREETGHDALGLFTLALEMEPGHLAAYQGVAELALQRDDFSPALRSRVLEGLTLSPDSLVLNLATAWIEYRDGNKPSAETRMQRALKNHPDLPFEVRQRIAAMLRQIQQ